MVASVADRIAEIRRTRKRPGAVVKAWMRREPRWLAECIAEEWQRQSGEPVAPSIVPTAKPQPSDHWARGPDPEPQPDQHPRYWWQDD